MKRLASIVVCWYSFRFRQSLFPNALKWCMLRLRFLLKYDILNSIYHFSARALFLSAFDPFKKISVLLPFFVRKRRRHRAYIKCCMYIWNNSTHNDHVYWFFYLQMFMWRKDPEHLLHIYMYIYSLIYMYREKHVYILIADMS